MRTQASESLRPIVAGAAPVAAPVLRSRTAVLVDHPVGSSATSACSSTTQVTVRSERLITPVWIPHSGLLAYHEGVIVGGEHGPEADRPARSARIGDQSVPGHRSRVGIDRDQLQAGAASVSTVRMPYTRPRSPRRCASPSQGVPLAGNRASQPVEPVARSIRSMPSGSVW